MSARRGHFTRATAEPLLVPATSYCPGQDWQETQRSAGVRALATVPLHEAVDVGMDSSRRNTTRRRLVSLMHRCWGLGVSCASTNKRSLLYVYRPGLSCVESMWSLKEEAVISWPRELPRPHEDFHTSQEKWSFLSNQLRRKRWLKLHMMLDACVGIAYYG